MSRIRRGVVSLALMLAIGLVALIAGMQVQQSYKPERPEAAEQLKAAGRNLGAAIGGAPGAAVGENLGYFLALIFGITAAQRHATAAASAAKLQVLSTTTTQPTAK